MRSLSYALRHVRGTWLLLLAILLAGAGLALGKGQPNTAWHNTHAWTMGVIPDQAPFHLASLFGRVDPGAAPPRPVSPPRLDARTPAPIVGPNHPFAETTRQLIRGRLRDDVALRNERAAQLRKACRDAGGVPAGCESASRHVFALDDIAIAYPVTTAIGALRPGDVILTAPIWVGSLVVPPAGAPGAGVRKLGGNPADAPGTFSAVVR